MKSRYLSLLVVVAILATVLTGCKSDTGGNEIRIGAIQDHSGATATWGVTHNNAIIQAVEDLNEQGGLLKGKKIKLIQYDFKCKVEEALTAYSRLVDQDKVVAVLGPAHSGVMMAMAPVAEDKKVPIISGAMDERSLIPGPGQVYKYHFLNQPSAYQQAEAIASYALFEMGITKVAILYNQGNPYAVSLAAPFAEYFMRHGGTVVANEPFQPGTKDFRPQLTKIKQLNPEAIHVTNYLQENALIAQQMRELGMDMRILGNNACNQPFAEVAGEAVDGTVYPITMSPNDPRAQEPFAAYKERFGEEPKGGIHNVFTGHDNLMLLADAIERAGKADPEAIRDALESSTDVDTWTCKVTIDAATHMPIGFPLTIVEIQDGEYVILDDEYLPVYE